MGETQAPWFRVGFDDAISHAVHQPLFADLVIDLASRGHPIKDFEKAYGADHAASLGGNPAVITEWAFDIGGMWTQGQPKDEITIDGLSIQIACDHWHEVLCRVKEAPLRRFGDDGPAYYKLKIWRHATVLTLPQRNTLSVALHDGEARALRRAAEFFAEYDKRMERS